MISRKRCGMFENLADGPMPCGKSNGVEELLAACEATPETHGLGWARLFMRWDGQGLNFDRFFLLRDTNRQDADSAAPLGSDTNCPSLDLLSDEFLDIGHVGVRFEFPPAGFVCWVNHENVFRGAGRNDVVPRSSLGIPHEGIRHEDTQGIQRLESMKIKES